MRNSIDFIIRVLWLQALREYNMYLRMGNRDEIKLEAMRRQLRNLNRPKHPIMRHRDDYEQKLLEQF